MRVSRAQAEINRQTVIDTASRLFRENGFDGIGLKDLMKGAGLTQGAFYKQFESKEDLAAQASNRAFECSSQRWLDAVAGNDNDPLGAVLSLYLSAGHRDERMAGCPLVALGADAVRKGGKVSGAFEAGIRERLDMLSGFLASGGAETRKAEAMTALSTMVGALLLSRLVDDEDLSAQILNAADKAVRELAADGSTPTDKSQ